MKKLIFLMSIFLFLPLNLSAQNVIYKCTKADNSYFLSTSPCPETAKVSSRGTVSHGITSQGTTFHGGYVSTRTPMPVTQEAITQAQACNHAKELKAKAERKAKVSQDRQSAKAQEFHKNKIKKMSNEVKTYCRNLRRTQTPSNARTYQQRNRKASPSDVEVEIQESDDGTQRIIISN